MDEDLGVKAPVTRLRRRLSVEADGAHSPATPSTPTKKRGGRLAKPALELINENVTENVSKRATPKSSIRDVVEPAEEKASAPVTPSRRSARIRSNTSLVMETAQIADSPRARRATRRNSQLGSDTEATTTPAKTRRTRKDSTSSVEKLAVTNPSEKLTAQVAEVIAEEPEKEITKDSKLDKSDDQSPSIRKSPRLNKKGNKTVDEAVKDMNKKVEQKDKTFNDSPKLSEENSQKLNETALAEKVSSKSNDKADDKLESKDSEKANLSLTSANLINEIDTNPKKSSVFNKTAPSIEELKIEKNNRKRTKSWTTNNLSIGVDNVSDKISNIDKSRNNLGAGDSLLKDKIDIKSPNRSAMVFNVSVENKENMHFYKSVDVLDASDAAKFLGKAPSKDVQPMVFIDDSDSNSGSVGSKLSNATTVRIGILDVQDDGDSQHNDGEDQCVPVVTQPTSKRSSPSESFTVEPMDIDETIPGNVTINDYSDKANSSNEEDMSNSKRKSSISKDNSIDMTDGPNKSKRTSSISLQPEGNNSMRKSSASEEKSNVSKVAMTKSDRFSLSDKSQRKSSISLQEENEKKANGKANKSKRKSSQSKVESENIEHNSSINSQAEDSKKINESINISKTNESVNKSKVNESVNKSKINESAKEYKRKSVSDTESQNLEKTANENRSTLVLSQLKDVSTNETNNVSKSPNDTNNELSKSVNIPIVTKGTDKNYLTSTPLQQKSLQKMVMQINTSIISPNASKNTLKVSESNNNSKVDKTTPKKNVTKVANNLDSSNNESEDESSDESKMIDDEAEEASDDYESGDSRNDEERQYEIDHEVVEKGETLESEQEFSNDSDYEKDSFIVSSDEEDDDLLSGSGDDLSMSDKELKMTLQSKKKFDERKRKEQKKASKEMYEARHKLDKSDNSPKPKTKKPKRQRLESSVLESENDEKDKPKKKNRLRIDSSHDASLNKSENDTSVCTRKKKSKRLSESVCEDNEEEMTMNNQSATEKNDPLSVSIKKEPKTPQRDLSMSTVHITDNIEEVQLDGNVSVIKPNETTDPLQATLVHEDEDSDSEISENMEIRANYDSVLENLNKSNKMGNKVKTVDTSLNLNKNAKDKVKEPIVDQLNLTQVKKQKKNKALVVEDTTEAPQLLSKNKVSVYLSKTDDGDISDSIDMRLIFPEDSNDSETNANKFKAEENQKLESVEEFIPLKRTEAKTNIRESMDLNTSTNESVLNVSKKKNKDRKSTQCITLTKNEPEGTNVSFFIDTKGSHEDVDMSNSAKKSKKKNKKNVSMENTESESLTEIADKSITELLPHDVSIKSDKKKKKNKNNDSSATVEQNAEVENVSQSGKKKSKKTSDNNDTENDIPDTSITEFFPHEQSLKSDKKKKKNKNIDVSTQEEQITEILSYSLSGKEKKAKRTSESAVNDIADATITDLLPQEVSFKSDKKKKAKRMSENAVDDITLNNAENSDNKEKKNKNSHGEIYMTREQITEANESHSEKEKSKRSIDTEDNQSQNENTEETNEPQEVSLKSDKSNKSDVADPVMDDNALNTSGKKKKNKKKKTKIMSELPEPEVNAADTEEVTVTSKKRKRDHLACAPSTNAADDEIIITNNQKKKKRKVSHNDAEENDDLPTEERISYIGEVQPCDLPSEKTNKTKKNKKSKKKGNIQETDQAEVLSNTSKKRKASEIDDGQKKSKVFKENSLDSIHVPRLPESIVNQLDDKPPQSKKQKKAKVISTVPFEVEQAKNRKNKPSKYLEQSIYLNDSPVKQNQKASLKNPKVLPFTPTAITSGKGYTSNFKINVIPQETEFVAQASDISNFRNQYLSNQRIKKLGTLERFKKQRNQKLSKF